MDDTFRKNDRGSTVHNVFVQKMGVLMFCSLLLYILHFLIDRAEKNLFGHMKVNQKLKGGNVLF